METYGRFLFEFLDQFFSGFKEIFVGLWNGIINIFNIPEYYNIIQHYKEDFSMSEWFLTGPVREPWKQIIFALCKGAPVG